MNFNQADIDKQVHFKNYYIGVMPKHVSQGYVFMSVLV